MMISWLILLSSIVNGGAAPAAAAPAMLAPVVPSKVVPSTVVPTATPHPVPHSKQWQLNGVELGDAASEVKGTWGSPSIITTDELQNDCETWSYRDGKNVGLCSGEVSFVQITADANKANLDGDDINLLNKDLRQALGKPEFEAEDGWGVVNGAEALKVFLDDRGSLVSLDLFLDPCNA